MARSTAPLVSITGIAALLDRLDPHTHGTCTVPGCVHDEASVRVGRGRSRPERPTPTHSLRAEAA